MRRTDAQWREHNRRHKLIDRQDRPIDDPEQQTMFGVTLNLAGKRTKDDAKQGRLF